MLVRHINLYIIPLFMRKRKKFQWHSIISLFPHFFISIRHTPLPSPLLPFSIRRWHCASSSRLKQTVCPQHPPLLAQSRTTTTTCQQVARTLSSTGSCSCLQPQVLHLNLLNSKQLLWSKQCDELQLTQTDVLDLLLKQFSLPLYMFAINGKSHINLCFLTFQLKPDDERLIEWL